MKKFTLLLIIGCYSFTELLAQSVSLDPSSASKLQIKATSNDDSWGNFGTTSETYTGMVFRKGISNTNNWQNTGVITGALGFNGTGGFGQFLASYYMDLGLYGINRVQFGTNGSYRMLLDGSGNLGLGTMAPDYKLDVQGNGYFASSPMTYSNLTSSYIGGVLTVKNATGYNSYLKLDGANIQAFASTGLFSSYNPNNMSLNPYGGSVGIGTPYAPSGKLEVRASSSSYAIRIKGPDPYITFNRESNDEEYSFLRSWSTNEVGYGGYGLEIGTPPSNKGIYLTTGYNLRMYIGPNGGVGINTTNLGSNQLSVNGITRSKEVIVETGWADYVFDEEYKLRSIDELEIFIKKNKHLPNIPKASEIETKGLYLGETNKAMMEKIEELALYIIQQQKEINALKKRLDDKN